MAGCVALAALARRQYSRLNALSAAAILLLVIDPLQLLTAGFQLSFAIVGGLILLYRPMKQRLFGRWLAREGQANSDHYNGLVDLVRGGAIRRVYLNEYFGAVDLPGGDPAAEGRMMDLLREHGVEVVHLAAGQVTVQTMRSP